MILVDCYLHCKRLRPFHLHNGRNHRTPMSPHRCICPCFRTRSHQQYKKVLRDVTEAISIVVPVRCNCCTQRIHMHILNHRSSYLYQTKILIFVYIAITIVQHIRFPLVHQIIIYNIYIIWYNILYYIW